MSAREVERMKAQGETTKTEAPPEEMHGWTDKRTGEIHKIPKGIDPGWDYNVGQAHQNLQRFVPRGIEPGTLPGGYLETVADIKTLGKQSIDKLPAKPLTGDMLLPRHQDSGWTEQDYINRFLKEFGAKMGTPAIHYDTIGEAMVVSEQLFLDRSTGKFKVFVADREQYLMLLADTLKDPVETWLTVVGVSGEKRICKRYIGLYKGDKKSLPGFVVFDRVGDLWLGTTTFRPKTLKYLDEQRQGTLLYTKK